ncbi:MAG: glycosyltransferase family 4 protein, partial [Planctomycetota bacterium]
VRALSPSTMAQFEQARVQYRLGYLDTIGDPADDGPFRLFFAGRLEADKGIFELLEIARQLEREAPGQFAWELAGAGGARDALAREIQYANLDDRFRLVGKLDRHGMRDAYERCHAVVVPTNRDFAEGLNRVSVEGVLAGRPVITSRLSNALDVLGGAVVEVPPENVSAYGDAVLALAADRPKYEERRARCAEVSDQFYDRNRAWGAGLDRALARVYGNEPQLVLPA